MFAWGRKQPLNGFRGGWGALSSAQIHQLGRATNNKSLTYLHTYDQSRWWIWASGFVCPCPFTAKSSLSLQLDWSCTLCRNFILLLTHSLGHASFSDVHNAFNRLLQKKCVILHTLRTQVNRIVSCVVCPTSSLLWIADISYPLASKAEALITMHGNEYTQQAIYFTPAYTYQVVYPASRAWLFWIATSFRCSFKIECVIHYKLVSLTSSSIRSV